MTKHPFEVRAMGPRRSVLGLVSAAVGLLAPLLVAESAPAQSAACRSMDPAQWPASSKPYFMLAIDTSGSMVECTDTANAGTDTCKSTATKNSCNLEPTRLNGAKCAVQKTIQAFSGQVNFGLMTYGRTLSGCSAGAVTDSCTANDGSNCGSEHYSGRNCTVTDFEAGNSCGNTPDCNGGGLPSIYQAQTINGNTVPAIIGGGSITMPGAGWRNGGNVVVDMLKDPTWAPGSQPANNTAALLEWVDGRTDNSREIFADGSTPLEGILRTAHQYYVAGWSSAWHDTYGRRPTINGNYCATGGPTIDHPSPIDPLNDRPCRSLNVILVTDGDETCGGTAVNAASALYKVGVVINPTPATPATATRVSIKTYVIGFAGATKSALDAIATAGGTTSSYTANNEVQLSQALASIISGSVSPEVCDNTDNNCNGCVDEGSQLYCNRNKTATPIATLNGAGTKTLSMCCQWTTTAERTACLNAYSSSITAAKPKGDQWFLPCWDANTDTTNISTKWLCSDPGEVCDSKDNNCEVQVDKSLASFANNVSDEQQLKCGSPLHCPTAEACPANGQDDDCDGVIDNAPGSGIPGSACPGSCVFTPEICNGCDDDCDGIADNGIADVACGFSPPANCAGVRKCPAVAVSGPGACIPGVTKPGTSQYGACLSSPAPNDTTCDNIDDNCNGQVDEGAPPTACNNGQPALKYKNVPAGQNLSSQCQLGQQACHTTTCIGWVGPSQEICDGIDNDCNGIVDDNVAGVGVACGTSQGTCTKGTTACVGGTIVCTGGKQPQPEVCNGVDDNCNGQTDEAPLNDGPSAPGCWTDAGATCTFTGAVNTLTWKPPAGATCSGVGTLTTPCRAGALVCNGASGWSCQGPVGPQPEVCDGIDNNCNGQVDGADSAITGVGGVCLPPGTVAGSACQGTTQCTSGVLSCSGGATPTAEICDGKDNDCDGLTDAADPDLVGVGGVCGVNRGICKTGTYVCQGGGLVCQGEVKPGTETCNGLDDDCDGVIDDTPSDTPAQLGCWNLPGTQCAGGGLTWNAPAGGTCTGVGTLTAPCSAGLLVCAGVNKWVCQGGNLPGAETCDGVDNNCNGSVDENNPGGGGACGTAPNVGPCKKGTLTCSGGQLLCQGEIKPSTELCDGIDNDCNGTKDDNITAGVGNACGSSTGICQKGLTACVNGSIQCSGGVPKGTEVCNGLDDDCDGIVDNNLTDGPANPGCWQTPGNTCTFKNLSWSAPPGATCNGVGSLTTPCATGTLTCGGTSGWFCQGGTPPQSEICDSKDNNCNGQVDENNPGGGVSCGSDKGECKPGVLTCTSGSLVCGGGVSPSPEICDGKDNNCDGQIDEPANMVGLGQICGSDKGECKPGIMVCDAVTHQPVCQGEKKPSPEICDNKDNDCNGTIDDNPTETPSNPGCWQNPGTSCSFGAVKWDPPAGATCNGVGTLSSPCSAGALICKNGGWQCLGGRLPASSETCDAIDNDCNGKVDDGDPGGGAQCGKSNVGECRFGQIHCTGGQLLCIGEVPPTPELCDNKDNDCNGTVDENAPGSGVPCTGQCSTGLTKCISGALICETTRKPTPEVCNGIDDDCNGLVDDPSPATGKLADAPADGADGCWNVPGTSCSYGTAPGPVTKWDPIPGATCTGLGTLTAPCQTGRLRCDGTKGWSCVGGVAPSAEICDGKDNDCDGTADDGDPGGGAQCGIDVGECDFGKQHCVNGTLQCDGISKKPEVCNGKDDDCDGQVDNGLPLGNACPATYDTRAYPGDRNQGECRPGKLACDPAGSGRYICNGGTPPAPEVCDGKDNDCDGFVDEAGPAPDGIDGSADPLDAHSPPQKIGDKCGSNVGQCVQGRLGCVGGQVQCVGNVKPQPEICDCADNDCDGVVDNEPKNGALCGSGTACVKAGDACQCASPCKGGEFACPTGFDCETLPQSSDPDKTGRYCVSDACGDCSTKTVTATDGTVECGPDGTVDKNGKSVPVCACKGGTACHGPCFTTACDTGFNCVASGEFVGQCRPTTDCRFFDCPAGKACNAGACVVNPCEKAKCKASEVCKPSPAFDSARCVPSCADVKCKSNEVCVEGECQPTGCPAACPQGELCIPSGGDGGGACGPNKCTTKNGDHACNDGSYCDPYTGSCGGNDPCSGVKCPSGQVCVAGECEKGSTPGTGGGAGGGTGVGGDSATGAGGSTGLGGNGGGAVVHRDGGAQGGSGATTSHGGAAGGEPENDPVMGLATGGGGCRCDLTGRGTPFRQSAAVSAIVLGLLVARRRKRRAAPTQGQGREGGVA